MITLLKIYCSILSRMEERLREVLCPCIVLIVAYYVMYDRSITLQRLTAQHSSKCRLRGREEKRKKGRKGRETESGIHNKRKKHEMKRREWIGKIRAPGASKPSGKKLPAGMVERNLLKIRRLRSTPTRDSSSHKHHRRPR